MEIICMKTAHSEMCRTSHGCISYMDIHAHIYTYMERVRNDDTLQAHGKKWWHFLARQGPSEHYRERRSCLSQSNHVAVTCVPERCMLSNGSFITELYHGALSVGFLGHCHGEKHAWACTYTCSIKQNAWIYHTAWCCAILPRAFDHKERWSRPPPLQTSDRRTQ